MNLYHLVSISLISGVFILIFGIAYLKNKENMARIQNNENLNEIRKPISLLTVGIIFIGIAMGVLSGLLLNDLVFHKTTLVIYLITLLFFVGIAMVVSDQINKKSA
ncbi:hypothetical protein [Pedobacter endophyticus]|uniref:DUF3784 domain-containing protein n=1 Tax=Pedobacter endophyticus TaxID=2789740 RepID=A0A7S9PZJ3_9SPHI|nr:hypothetical protein [Pedobacter endophyticus]QPH40578.1 hypothetical protein IZT61_04675 [Pedobacter endophyticus]